MTRAQCLRILQTALLAGVCGILFACAWDMLLHPGERINRVDAAGSGLNAAIIGGLVSRAQVARDVRREQGEAGGSEGDSDR